MLNNSKITMEVGGWVQVPLGEKNRPNIIIFLYRCFVVVYYACIVCTLLKGVSHDFECSIHVSNVSKKNYLVRKGGGLNPINFHGIFDSFITI